MEMKTHKEFLEWFGKQLEEERALRVENSIRFSLTPKTEKIVRAAGDIIMAPGKRLRPYLAYLGFVFASGKDIEKIRKLTLGVEFFHDFALIHDDILDQDMERRGIPTLNAKFGDGAALLAGDLVFHWALEMLMMIDGAPKAFHLLRSQMIETVIGGQFADIESANSSQTKELMEKIIMSKTADYSFVMPLKMGAALAGGNELFNQFAESFGQAFGFAFQIQDDYFDREKDKDRGQPNYFSLYSKEEGLHRMKEHFEKTHTILNSFNFGDSDFKEELRKIIVWIEGRVS